jgi:malate dehydrogenase (oxaloacetate-decarboxylating)(NADP+)
MEMKIAAAEALAALAREDVPDEVAAAYGRRPPFGATTSSRRRSTRG